jgi:hypothetical protein
MKSCKLWHRAQIYIFYDMEHTSYILLWHTGNFLEIVLSKENEGSRILEYSLILNWILCYLHFRK